MLFRSVFQLVEPIDQLAIGHPLAAAQLQRARQHAREHRFARAAQPRVNQVRETDVVIGGRQAQDDRRDGERNRHQPDPAFAPDRLDSNSDACDGRTCVQSG